MLGKTAHYEPTSMEITVYTDGRHPKDMMRSIAHEMVHHMQNENGMFDDNSNADHGYAQNNPHLRKMEEEAYLKGNMCFRDWEDGYKSKHKDIFYERRIRKMSTKKWKNKELSTLLNERWGFSMNLDKLTESKKEYDLEEGHDRIFAPSHYCLHHVVYEGKEGYTVDHNWNEKLQKVTKYDVKFEDGSIIRNIHESKLTALEAFSEGSHSGKRDDGHPPAKRDDSSKEKPDFPDVDGDGDRKEPISKASKEKKEKGGNKKKKDYSKVPDQLKKHVAGDAKEEKNELQMRFPQEGSKEDSKKTMADLKDKDDKKKQVKMKEAEEMSVDELAQKIRDFATIEKLRQALKRAEEMEKEDKDDKKDS
jgi:hypothetical protein